MNRVLSKYVSFSLVLFPFFSCYNIGTIALYKFLMSFNALFLLVAGQKKFLLPRSLRTFYIYIYTVPVICAISIGATTNFLGSFLTPLLFGLNLVLMLPHLDFREVKRYYGLMVAISCFVFFLQELSYYTLGTRFGALIPFFDIYTGESASQFMKLMADADRSCSLFSEPSHFAQYIAPYLVLELYILNKKKRLFNGTVIILSLIFIILRSGNGLFLCAIIWCSAFFFSSMSVKKKVFVVVPLALLSVVYGYNYFSKTEKGEELLARSEQLEAEQDRVSSGMIRIYRGFFVFSDMDSKTKIFGVGAGGADYVIDNGKYNWMFGKNDHYLNNASFLLVAYGFIGTFLFLLYLYTICKVNNFFCTIVAISFIGLSLMESFIFETRMLMYLGLASMAFKPEMNNNNTLLTNKRIKEKDECKNLC